MREFCENANVLGWRTIFFGVMNVTDLIFFLILDNVQETFMYWKRMATHRRRFSKYLLVQYTLGVLNPGGDVIVCCT